MRFGVIKVKGFDHKYVGIGMYGELQIVDHFSISHFMPVDMAVKECAKANAYNNPSEHGFIINAEHYPQGYEIEYYNVTKEQGE